MLKASDMLVIQKCIKTLSVDLNDECARSLAKYDWDGRQGNVDCRTPYTFLLVVQNQLSPTFKVTRVKMEENTVKVVVIWSTDIDTIFKKENKAVVRQAVAATSSSAHPEDERT